MSKYKLIQLTNNNVGAIAVDTALPFGNITRRLNSPGPDNTTFTVATTGANIVYLNEPGYYNVIYSLSGVAGAAGVFDVTLTTNGTDIYTSSVTTTADGTFNITLPYSLRVCPNSCGTPTNCPVGMQLMASGVALTGGVGNLIVEKVQ
jgi:hypothetical protein